MIYKFITKRNRKKTRKEYLMYMNIMHRHEMCTTFMTSLNRLKFKSIIIGSE